MTKLNRKKAPAALPIEGINYLETAHFLLQNGIPVYLMNAGSQDIVKIDLIIEAGQWFSENILCPVFCNRMLLEGSKSYAAADIADKLDYYGTFSNLECGKHFSHIQLFTLSHFFDKSLSILEEIVKYPTFPEDKLKVLVQNEMQQYVVSREKPEVLAAEEFVSRIFGTGHPYGRVRTISDYENVSIDQIKAFHQHYYHASNCKIMVSGKLNGELKSSLETHFGGNDWNGTKALPIENGFDNPVSGRFLVNKSTAVQSSIMIGKKTINKKHPDFFGLSILDTILGGYFGSRLMTNLREKNALTYGVYSSLSSMLHAGNFSISANVNAGFTEKAIKQIYHEIEILKKKLVPGKELQMVKNFLSGEMLRSFDGPIPMSEIFIDLLAYGLDFDFYRQYFDTIKNITPETIRDLANKYLQKDNFVEVIAGNIDSLNKSN